MGKSTFRAFPYKKRRTVYMRNKKVGSARRVAFLAGPTLFKHYDSPKAGSTQFARAIFWRIKACANAGAWLRQLGQLFLIIYRFSQS